MVAVFGDKELIKKIKRYSKPYIIDKEETDHHCPNCNQYIFLPNKYTTHDDDECECCGQYVEGELIIDEFSLPFIIQCKCGIRARIAFANEEDKDISIKWLSKYQK